MPSTSHGRLYVPFPEGSERSKHPKISESTKLLAEEIGAEQEQSKKLSGSD